MAGISVEEEELAWVKVAGTWVEVVADIWAVVDWLVAGMV